MLYITTRSEREVYSAQQVLKEAWGPDGGHYLPYRHPSLSREDFRNLAKKPFAGRIAWVLNHLFSCRLSMWDVEFAVGRSPVRLVPLGSRLFLAETWHNPGWDYATMAHGLARMLGADEPKGWLSVALRTAVLLGIIAEFAARGMESPDISLVSGDFSGPISAFYARQWGAHIGDILCCCNENNELWNLLSHGQLRTDSVSVRTVLPEADVTLPQELERLIYEAGGCHEVEHYLDACRRGAVYQPEEGVLAGLRRGMAVSVVSTQRILQTIPGAYATHRYVLDPAGALAYAGLMDYRAKTGRTGCGLILSDSDPRRSANTVAEAMGISAEELENRIS